MTSSIRIFIFSLLLLSFLPPSPSHSQVFAAVVLRVIDGDTIKINIQGKPESVRLIGIDTPESKANAKAMRDCNRSGQDVAAIVSQGRVAAAYTRSRVKKGDTVRIETDVQQRDKYRRILAYVWLPDGRPPRRAGRTTSPPGRSCRSRTSTPSSGSAAAPGACA